MTGPPYRINSDGNTPKQETLPNNCFMPGGHLNFDENTDSIGSYVLRMSQVTAMLNYGEMQILENFKNTLPYRLYLILINVNNLRDAIDLAKRVLTKEKTRWTTDWTILHPIYEGY